MSRYTIPALNPDYEVTVGWDNPLRSFFLHVEDTTILAAVRANKDDHRDPVILWVGTEEGELQSLDSDLLPLVGDYARMPDETLAQLRTDQATAPPQTPLQQHMLRMLRRVRQMP